MGPGTGPTGRINPADLAPVSPAQQYCDSATAEIQRIVTAAVTPLAARLSGSGYAELRNISGLDDTTVTEQERRSRIGTAAGTEATTLIAAARTELLAAVDLTQAPTFGLDPTRTRDMLDRLLVEGLRSAVEGKMSESLQELIQNRTEYLADRTKEAKNIAKEIADNLARDLNTDDRRGLRALLETNKTRMSPQDRYSLVEKSAVDKAGEKLTDALSTLDSRVPTARATALGMNPTELDAHGRTDLSKFMKITIQNKLTEGYDQLCEESATRAQARSSAWGMAKWLSPLAIGAATYATIAVIGGTSAVFWVPVGTVVATCSFAFCKWQQSATRDKHLR